MGQTCCESKGNLNKNITYIPPNNNPMTTNNFTNVENGDTILQPPTKVKNNVKIIEVKKNEENTGPIIEDPPLEPSNNAGVSLGSSVNMDDSNDKDNINSNDLEKSRSMASEKVPIPNPNINDNFRNINKISKEDILPLECIQSFEAHQEKIVCLIELNSKKIATGSYDCTIKIWNLANFECEKTLNEGGCVLCLLEFENDMILCGTNESTIHLWDINNSFNNQSIHTFEGHLLWVNCLVKCNDNFFASCSNDTDIRIWNYNSKQCSSILKGHNDCVLSLTQLNDGRLCSGSADLTIKIWNWELNNCDITLTGHDKWVKCVLQLSNGCIASGSDDKTIKIWRNNTVVKNLKGHEHSVRALCQISEDLFASASFDKTIKIWDMDNMECVQTLKGHNSNVIAILYHSEGYLISCSNDHYIKLWKKK